MDFVATLYSLSSHLNTAPQDVLDIFQATISVVSDQQRRVQNSPELDVMAFCREGSQETSILARVFHRFDSPLYRSSTYRNIYPSSTSFSVDEYVPPHSSTPSNTFSSPTFASLSQLWPLPSVAAFDDHSLHNISHQSLRSSNLSPHTPFDSIQTPFEATRRRATGEFKTQHPANDFVLGLHYEDATSDTMAGFVQEPVVSAQDGSSDTSESPHVHPPSQPQNPVLQFAVNNAGANWTYSSSNLAATLKDPLASPEPYNHTAISWGTNDGGLLPTRFGLNRSDLYDATSSAESYGDYSPHSSQPSPPAASLARDSEETEYALLPILPNSQGWTRCTSRKSGHHIPAGSVQLVYPSTWVSLAAFVSSSSPVTVTCRLLTDLPTHAVAPGPSIPAPQIHECGALIDTVEAFITHMEAHIGKKRRKGGNSARFRCNWNGCRTPHQVFDEGGYHRHLEQHSVGIARILIVTSRLEDATACSSI